MDTAKARERISGKGFIAALDQSGGSTPKALKAYGVAEGSWKDEADMFEMIHAMRTRIITNTKFDKRISGVILFERTMMSEIEGMGAAQYLWEKKQIVPFLKIDKGLEEEANGVQLMKPIPGLEDLLKRAVEHGIFGTKERSVINAAHRDGIKAIVEQQFELGAQVIKAGLMPIIEPEVNIKAADKAECEDLLRSELEKHLDQLPDDQQVMLKLTLPNAANFYQNLIVHPRVLRVVALSGGYSCADANEKLSKNKGMTASFSRALVEDLRIDQSDEEFTKALDAAIQGIYEASLT